MEKLQEALAVVVGGACTLLAGASVLYVTTNYSYVASYSYAHVCVMNKIGIMARWECSTLVDMMESASMRSCRTTCRLSSAHTQSSTTSYSSPSSLALTGESLIQFP